MIKPILFNTDMVRAILDGRKTVTRRLIKQKDNKYVFTGKTYSLVAGKHGEEYLYAECIKQSNGAAVQSIKCPYRVNDILYVRETWNFVSCENCIQKEMCFPKLGMSGCYIYRTDYNDAKRAETLKWRPSIHMPKEAARIFLKVTDVKVERLQDIDDKGAYEEGAGEKDVIYQIGGRVCEFKKIWQSTVDKKQLDQYGWNANPWVWMIKFERCEKPQGYMENKGVI